MFKYTFGIKKNFVRVTSEPNKTFQTLDFGKTSYNVFVLVRSEFVRLVEAPNKFIILVIKYSMF